MYPGRKIWSLICPIPDASVQALEQVKEVGEFFSSMPPLQNSVTSFSFKSSYTFLDMWMWDCESVRETAGSPPICQILGASNPHWVSDPRLSDFYPRHVHGAFIDIRALSPGPWPTAHPSSAPLHPPHAHYGVELVRISEGRGGRVVVVEEFPLSKASRSSLVTYVLGQEYRNFRNRMMECRENRE